MATLYDFDARTVRGDSLALRSLQGQVVLVVNTASECGFTPQLEGLEALWRRYGPRGFTVLGFPCNQFGRQEPGTDEQIDAFCRLERGVTFPVMAKVDVNGPSAHPLYRWLVVQAPGVLGTRAIKWNFTKFLVDRQGRVLRRYAPRTTPEALARDIEDALGS